VKWARACFLVLLVGTARAQVPDARAPRDVSVRWAEYYAAVYQVPVELVAAIIDEESGWNPYAVSKKGAAVRPVPGLAMDVVAENHCVLFPGIGRKLLVPLAGDNHRRMRPRLVPPRARGSNQYRGAGDG